MCRVCNGIKLKAVLNHPKGWSLLQCEECGLAFKTGVTTSYENLQAEYYERFNFDRSREASEVTRIMRNHIQMDNPLSILEIGCGTGALLNEFRKHGMKVYGFEPSANAVRISRERFGLSTIKTGYFTHNTFDIKPNVILLYDVIEHLEEPLQLLNAISGSMDRDCICIIKSGNPQSLNAKLYPKKWGYYLNDEHVAFYSLTALRTLCGKSNLKVEKYYNFRHAYGGLAALALGKNIVRAVINRSIEWSTGYQERLFIELANDHFVAVLKRADGEKK